MISKRIPCAPQVITTPGWRTISPPGIISDMELSVGQRFHDPQRHVEAGQGIAGNRMRQLSNAVWHLILKGKKEELRVFCLLMHALIDESLTACDGTDFSKDVKPEKMPYELVCRMLGRG